MKKAILAIFILSLFSCTTKSLNRSDDGLYGLNNHSKEFDFSTNSQLNDLPSFGKDPSYIDNGKLKSPIKINEHKGLGRKFLFKNNGGEPNESELEFELWLDSNFQVNGVKFEVGKFSGFEGIYDNTAGWGGKKVTNQNSWSVRIGHVGENSDGKIPIGLYVYHPEMLGNHGTVVNPNFALNREQTYTIKLYVKMNDLGRKNGVLILSVDGTEIYNSNSWLFRNENSVHIKSVWLDTYIGGKTPSKTNTYVLMDNLRIKW